MTRRATVAVGLTVDQHLRDLEERDWEARRSKGGRTPNRQLGPRRNSGLNSVHESLDPCLVQEIGSATGDTGSAIYVQ